MPGHVGPELFEELSSPVPKKQPIAKHDKELNAFQERFRLWLNLLNVECSAIDERGMYLSGSVRESLGSKSILLRVPCLQPCVAEPSLR